MIDDTALIAGLSAELEHFDEAPGSDAYEVCLPDRHAHGLPLLVVLSRMCPPPLIAHLIPWSRP